MASSSKQHFQTFTIGKLDAGMAILIGERAHLIEFPSLLLPPGSTSGSIVSISVHRNVAAEQTHARAFSSLQSQILSTYGTDSPQAPVLTLRNTTQTSVTLEWGKLELANAKLRGVEIYRNGTRLAAIPNPGHNTSTKLSSLSMDTDYTFQLVMKTTAGTYPSNVIRVRTHTINDTSGISVCFGTVQDPHHLHQAKIALDQMGAKYSDKIQIDTTHFVCTTPAGPVNGSGPSVEYQKALQLTLPVVEPGWVLACLHEKKMVAISQHMLGSSPAFNPLPSSAFERPSSPSLPPSPHTRASEDLHSFPQQHTNGEGDGEGQSEDPDAGISPETRARREEEEANERERNRPRTPGGGVLNRGFKFPLSSAEGGPPTPPPGSETFPPSPPSPVRESSPPPAPPAVVEEEPTPVKSEPEPTPPTIAVEDPSASVESVQSPIEVAISPPTPPPSVVEPEPELVVVEEQVEDASTSSAPPPPEIRIDEAETSQGATEEVVVLESAPATAGSVSEEEPEVEGGKVQGEKEVEVEEPVVDAPLQEVEIAEPEAAVVAPAPEETEEVGENDDVPAPPTITVQGEEDEEEGAAEDEEDEGEEEEGLKEVELGEKVVEEAKVGAGGGGGGKKKKNNNGKKGKGRK